MIALIQRVTQAEVRVQDRVAGAIHRGVLAFKVRKSTSQQRPSS